MLPFKRYRLAEPPGDGRHPYLDRDGAYLGPAVALVERRLGTGALTRFAPRPEAMLDYLLGKALGIPVDSGPIMGSLGTVARALNDGNITLALIALVQAGIDPLPDERAAARLKAADARLRKMLAREAHALKYSPDQPRVPAGQTGGGQWTSEGDGGDSDGNGGDGGNGDDGDGHVDGATSDGNGGAQVAQADIGIVNDGTEVTADPEVDPAGTAAEPRTLIDQDFLKAQEGFSAQFYVPDDKSGVTVGEGVDLGHMTADELEQMGVPEDIIDQVRPFLATGPDEYLTGADAQRALLGQTVFGNIGLTDDQAQTLSDIVLDNRVAAIEQHYNDAVGPDGTQFADLPVEARTAIASYGYQNGPDFGQKGSTQSKQFWDSVTSQNWSAAATVLESSTSFSPRRNSEADLLRSIKP